MLSSRRSVKMQSMRNSILAGALLLLSTKNAQSQDRDVLLPPLAEVRRACTSKQRMGHFRRSGSPRYECVLPNGHTSTLLTAARKGGPIRVIGVVYETRARRALRQAGAMNWLGLKEFGHDELTRWSRGSDGCVFAEWRGTLTTTVLLQCPTRDSAQRKITKIE